LWAWLILASSVSVAGEGKPGWQSEWEKTLQAAKKEGQVDIYTANDYDRVFLDFQKKYPEIKVAAITTANNPGSFHQIIAERRAGKFLRDLYIGGAATGYNILYKGNVLEPLKPTLILPEVLDQSRWWKGIHRYMDDKGEYIFGFAEMALPFVGFNTKLVNPKEFKSYWDLLNPKWKGKIIGLDPTMGSAVDTHLVFIYHSSDLGPEYLRRFLSEMDLAVSRDTRQIVDWLAAGKYAISIFTTPSRARLDDAKEQGLPVDWFGPNHLKEGVGSSTSSGNVGLVHPAPHPNAAKIAINWLLSREGQIAYQKATNGDSRRIDIPKDGVRLSTRRMEGVRYVETDSPERRNMEPIRKIVNESWKRGR
jgi:iron(III) transport system substrate-binding protein